MKHTEIVVSNAIITRAQEQLIGEPTDERVRRLLAGKWAKQHSGGWYHARAHMLTASNAASVIGANPYCSRKQLLKKATTTTKPMSRRGQIACEWGSSHEADAALLYSVVTGNKLVQEDIGLVIHRDYPLLGASPDRVLAHAPVLVEIKAPFRRRIDPHHVPAHYLPQVQMQMEVCDMEACHFVEFKPASLCDKGTIAITLILRDREWWQAHLPAFLKYTSELPTPTLPTPTPNNTPTAASMPPPTATMPADDKASIAVTPPSHDPCSGRYDVWVDDRIPLRGSLWLESVCEAKQQEELDTILVAGI